MPPRRTVLMTLSGLLLLSLFFLATTQHLYVRALRHTLYYHAMKMWWGDNGPPRPTEHGELAGWIQNEMGQPIAQAWVLVSEWDGTTHQAQTNEQGYYHLDSIPIGWYRPLVMASAYQQRGAGEVLIRPHPQTVLTVTLSPEMPSPLEPASQVTIGQMATFTCEQPFEVTAQSAEVHFNNAGQTNSLTFFYLPITSTTQAWPVLLTIYPGPVESWGCVSIALAAGGYAVLAVGPEYSFAIEQQLDELERLINLAQTQTFPQADGQRIGLLGGSFSSLHVQRLIQRRQDIQAVLMLGPPTDMFDLRRRFEAGIFDPPFGLDQVMIAAGLPSVEIDRYGQYSVLYHVQANFPPIALLHSRTDEVVPFQQTELLATRLAAVGVDYEAHFFEGASHYLLADRDGQDTRQVYQITLQFLDKHLKH